jgi:hypothetical protein
VKCPAATQGVFILMTMASLSCSRIASRRHQEGASSAKPASSFPDEGLAKLELRELFDSGPALRPTSKTLAARGERVRLQGFMAEMEMPPTGGFYLTPHPVHCDEAGGGTADLPPETVYVVAPSLRGKRVPFVKGPIEVIGTFEIGNQPNDDGQVSAFRLLIDHALAARLQATDS